MIMTVVKLPEKVYAKLLYLAKFEGKGIRKKASELLEFAILEGYFWQVKKNRTKKESE